MPRFLAGGSAANYSKCASTLKIADLPASATENFQALIVLKFGRCEIIYRPLVASIWEKHGLAELQIIEKCLHCATGIFLSTCACSCVSTCGLKVNETWMCPKLRLSSLVFFVGAEIWFTQNFREHNYCTSKFCQTF